MILKNYWRWMQATQRYSVNDTDTQKDIGLINISGNAQLMFTGMIGSSVGASTQSMLASNRDLSLAKFHLGTGDNTLTSDDYCLTNDVTSSFSNMTVTSGWASNDSYSRIYTVSGTNGTNAAITVTEIGITLKITADSDYNSSEVMLAIVKLSEPITVASGDTFTVSFEWVES